MMYAAGKYIVYDRGGAEDIIIFSQLEVHSEVARRLRLDVISAGFISFGTAIREYDAAVVPDPLCFGKSETLRVVSRGMEDNKVARRALGLTS